MQFVNLFARKKTPLVLLVVLIAGLSLRLYNLMYFHSMTADECVYTQAVFAMTKGYLPYRDIFIAHPLVFFIIEYPFISVNPSLFTARLPPVLLSLGTMLLIFSIARFLYSDSVAILAAALFTFSPYTIFYNKIAIADNAVLFFITLSLYFFLKYYKGDCKKHLFLSGLSAGIAFISKYSAAFVIIVLMLFLAIKSLKKLASFMLYASIAPLAFILLLFLLNIQSYWYTQTVNLQLIRFSFPLSFKMLEFGIYITQVWPLLVMAVPIMRKQIPLIGKKTDKDVMLTLLYITPLLIMLFGKIFISWYPLMLTPILCILAAHYLDQKASAKRKTWVSLLLVIFLTHFCVSSSTFLGSGQSEFAIRAKLEVADYIRSITDESDKIWTTEADIAFFARRLIVPPDSEVWKYQGFYEDVWGYMGTSYVGRFTGHHGGLITLNEIRQAIENEKPKVVVIIRHKIADDLIWNGINNPDYEEEGLAEYISARYNLNYSIYDIEVYVRREI